MSPLENPPHPADALLTQKQAAGMLAVSTRTIRRLMEDGELPVIRFGRAVRLRPSDLAALVERRCGEGDRRAPSLRTVRAAEAPSRANAPA